MLTKCPDCGCVSINTEECPNCGAPIDKTSSEGLIPKLPKEVQVREKASKFAGFFVHFCSKFLNTK